MCSTTVNLELVRDQNDPNYRLVVNFQKENKEDNFVFLFNRVVDSDESTCIDVMPINSKCGGRFLKNTFRVEDVGELSKELEFLRDLSCVKVNSLGLFVLDLKDSGGERYQDGDEIRASEDLVRDFLQNPLPKIESARRDFHKLIHGNDITCFLREGSLKNRLVTQVFDQQAYFLEMTVPGRDSFCEICEFLMNGFKMGYEIQVHTGEGLKIFKGSDYIVSIHNVDCSAFGRSAKLLTLYSERYAGTFSADSRYFNAISQIFNPLHEVNNDGITAITIEQP